MGTYTESPYSYSPGNGGSGGGGSGNPGGLVNSLQYNLDTINFGGFGSYNSGTGLVTLPQHLILENDTNSNFQINNITFLQDGSGSLFLGNDGAYHPLSLVDTNFAFKTSVAPPINFTLFTFPTSFSSSLIIQWNYANQQVIIVNSDASDTLSYSLRAIWDTLDVGMPARHYQYNAQLVGAGNIILTNTNDYITGLDLSTVPSNVDLYLSISSALTTGTILLDCTLMRTEYPSASNYIEIKGEYEVV